MKVRIPTQGFRLTPAIGAHVHVKLSGMLNKHTEDAVGVDVYLNGLNGPVSQSAKRVMCSVKSRLNPIVCWHSFAY